MVSDYQLSISFEDTYSLDMDMNIWWSMYVICSAISSADSVSIFSLLGVCNKNMHRGTDSKLYPSLILCLNVHPILVFLLLRFFFTSENTLFI